VRDATPLLDGSDSPLRVSSASRMPDLRRLPRSIADLVLWIRAGCMRPLTRSEIEALATDGLTPSRIEKLADPERPAERRWRAAFERPAGQQSRDRARGHVRQGGTGA